MAKLEETYMTSIRRWFAWFTLVVVSATGLAIAVAIVEAAPAHAQAGPDAIFTVTTLDVAPSATAQGIALLKQYRDVARKQVGSLGIDLLQESGFPNRFAIHETWSNRSAFDANEKAAHAAALRDGLQPIAGGPYDRRTYRALSIGSSRSTGPGSGAVYLLVHLDVFPPGLAPTLAAVKEVATTARGGEGNLRYDVEQGATGGGNHMTFYAVWQSRDDFDDYERSAYARHLRDIVGPLLGSPFDDRLYALID
jgi:quinol monooxygenase YgiN